MYTFLNNQIQQFLGECFTYGILQQKVEVRHFSVCLLVLVRFSHCMLVIKEACSSLCSIPSPSAKNRTEGLLDARQAPGREFSSVSVAPKRVLIPNSSYCSIDLVPTFTSDNDWSTWCLCAFAILFVCFKSTESYNMPSCDWNLSPNIFLKFISYERHQLSVPFMLLSSILLYNIHCVHPFTSWYRPSGIFLFGTIMNIIKALVFKYFCGYVVFFFYFYFSWVYAWR